MYYVCTQAALWFGLALGDGGIYFESASLASAKQTRRFGQSASGSVMMGWMWVLGETGRMVKLQIPFGNKF